MQHDVWNPFETPKTHARPLTSAGTHPDGTPRAVARFRTWTALEQIGFEDSLGTQLIGKAVDGSSTVLLGEMKRAHLQRTLVGIDGLPEQITRELTADEVAAGRRGQIVDGVERPMVTEALDLRRPEHLGLFPVEVYLELIELAQDVQPTVVSGAKSKAAATTDDDEDGDQGPDPSRAPRTDRQVRATAPAGRALAPSESTPA